MGMFKIGDRVKCIYEATQVSNGLVKDHIYTVFKVLDAYDSISISEQEAINNDGWYSSRFILVDSDYMPEPDMDLDEIHAAQALMEKNHV